MEKYNCKNMETLSSNKYCAHIKTIFYVHNMHVFSADVDLVCFKVTYFFSVSSGTVC